MNIKLTPEDVVSKWDTFTNFGLSRLWFLEASCLCIADDGRATFPATAAESMQQIIDNFENKASTTDERTVKAKL